MKSGISDDDRQELAKCFTAHSVDLFGYACWITRGDRQLAEDLVQDSFHEAAARWQDVRGWSGERQGCWLRGIVHHLAVTSFRRAKLGRSKQQALRERYQPRNADTHEEAMTAIALQRCWTVIEQMPAQQHLAASLRWGKDMSIREIAEVLGIAQGTVSAHLASARKKLLEAVGPDAPFELGRPGERRGGTHE